MREKDIRDRLTGINPAERAVEEQSTFGGSFNELKLHAPSPLPNSPTREEAFREAKKDLLIKTLSSWVDTFVSRWLDNRETYDRESCSWIRGEVARIMERTGSHLSNLEKEGRDSFFITRTLNAFSKIEGGHEGIDRIIESLDNPFVDLCARHYQAGDTPSVIHAKINDIREDNFLFAHFARSVKGLLSLEIYAQLSSAERSAFIDASSVREPLARPRKDLFVSARSQSMYDSAVDSAVRGIFREQPIALLSLLEELPPTGVANKGQAFRPSRRHLIPKYTHGNCLNDLHSAAYDAFVDSPLSGAPFHILLKDLLKKTNSIAGAHGKPSSISWVLGGMMRDQMRFFAKNQIMHAAHSELSRLTSEDTPGSFTVYTELSRYFRLRGEVSDEGDLSLVRSYFDGGQWSESREEIGELFVGLDALRSKMYPTTKYRAFLGGVIATKFREQLEGALKESSSLDATVPRHRI
jgi:hypothetical protein